tara:strand:+ start:5125 stop:6492 length:1368 start_codon:yes stop_codon:yes gene_type:complete
MWEDAMQAVGPEPAAISKEEYRSRQDRLFSQFRPDDLLIITNPKTAIRSADVHYPYRASSDLMYLCGWTDPESVLIADYQNNEWVVTLLVQPKDVLMELWEGRRPGVEGAVENWAIDKAESHDDLELIISEKLQKASRVIIKSGVDEKIDSLVTSALQENSRNRQRYGTGPISVEDPSRRIAELRLRKSPSEISLMRHSAKIAAQAHVQAMRNTKSGTGEWQLEGVIEGFFKYAGSTGNAYPCIIGSGDNATILHYTVNDDICEDGEVVLIDAGCEYNGYASDITRSWPVNGKFSEAQAEIYELVLKSQIAAIKECKVGNPYDAPHNAARRVLAEGLIELGVIKQSLDDALCPDKGELKKWYMHNTGHWLGLDVHDVGVYRPNNESRVLEEGMVLTVEPGLYFGSWRPDVDCPKRYADIGIRIEDDVLVTANGPDVLSGDCPKTIVDIEAVVGTV